MATNVRISGANADSREESDIRYNYSNLQQIICASTKLGGNQPMSFSTDGGATWSQSSLPGVTGDARQGDPTIDWTSDGTAWSVTIGISPTSAFHLRTFKSVDQGATWTFDSDVDGGQSAMDKQALWIDHNANSPHQDNMYLTWHNGSPVFVSLRVGAAGTWGTPLQVSGSETTGTGIGGDIKTNANGDVFVFWPDSGSRNLFVAKSVDGGVSFGSPVTIAQTNGAFQVDVPAQHGRLVLIYLSGGAYRTTTEDLVFACWMDLAGGSGCDSSGDAPGSNVNSDCKTRIFFSRSTDGGATWESPRKINDQSGKNDQIFSRMAVDETTGVLMIVYYDTVDDPGRVKTNLWMQRSFDRGVTWTAPVRVTTAETDETSAGATSNFQYGDYIGLTGFAGNFFPCWTDRRSGAAEEIWGAPLTTSEISFIIEKSTFGKDEVTVGASYGPAYWLQVSGFSNSQLGLTGAGALNQPPNPAPVVTVSLDPSLNTGLTSAQLTQIAGALPTVNQFGPLPIVPTDPTLTQDPQTFLYPYTIAFNSVAAFGALLPDQAVVLTLNASLTVGQITRTASANIELVAGENPYYQNVNPADPARFPTWLSFDLRLFKMTVPPSQTADRFGATMTTNPTDAPGFITNVIANLTSGGGSVSGDSFESGLTQDEAGSALEFLQKDSNGNFVFNFAVARVRLKGNTPGAQAVKVRVFFRLFNAATTHSEFNPNTTYRFHSDGVLNGVKVPLLGVQNDQNGQPEYVTIPCFAVPRINLASPADMNTQPEDAPNAYTIDVVPGSEVDSFFGCWLDINQPQQKFLAQTPVTGNFDGPFSGSLVSLNEAITRAPHQCLIAEIRFDDTPIPFGANSATSDKIAQRNIAWIDGPNPGVLASRRMPHPFEIRPSSLKAALLDELMILWGNTPIGSQAQFYLPSLDAHEIVSLARAATGSTRLTVVDSHTLQVPVGGVTFIPLPRGTARSAGLLTVDLPEGVKRGDIYEIAVRQITEATAASRTPQPGPDVLLKAAAQTPERRFSWLRQLGAFQVTIAISTRQLLQRREERLYAWLLFIQKAISQKSRWYPVFTRYLDQIRGRVRGFGGDPDTIEPSATGDVPRPEPHGDEHERLHLTGKVMGVVYDRFGDFEGFHLLTEDGHEHAFHAREGAIEELVRQAWLERMVVTVFVERSDSSGPISIVLRRAPRPYRP
ncbi:MAG TPA: sialidase family protein [Vicinamibacterales bacterium]|nr:sialidase family protein [Vicinamibacterales bacterium]